MLRLSGFALTAVTLFPGPALAQTTNDDVPHDDVKGRWHNYNVEPVSGIVFSDNSARAYVVNQPGARLAAFNVDTLHRIWEAPIGPGTAAMVRRPGTNELWLVDRVTSTVGVVDIDQRRLVRTLRVGAEPHGIAFSANGDRAYVACSGADRVDVVRVDTFSVVNSIPIPAREPRAILRVGAAVYVAALLSGNGTAPLGRPGSGGAGDALEVLRVSSVPNATPLPDRDLFRIPIGPNPETDALDQGWTRTGVGTLLFNLHKFPGLDQLWIPHLESLNGDVKGEALFVAGQVVRNRIAVVNIGSNSAPLQIALDTLTPSPERRCAPPTGVAFDPLGLRAFVCGYGSNNVTVLGIDNNPPVWLGDIEIRQHRTQPSISLTPQHSGAGPRICEISPDGRTLLVLNSGENSLTKVALQDLPAPPFSVQAPQAVALGWDPLPIEIVQGRLDFARTRNSKSGTSSCASCHSGGHVDGLAWNLGGFLDAEGTAPDALQFPIDDKGPLVTQTVRRLREVGPWHWRGEKRSLFEFDAAFVGLLENQVNGQPAGLEGQINYLVRYMESLTWPSNPAQPLDRRYTSEQLAGADIFLNKVVRDGLTCAGCHPLPLGTAGEVFESGLGGHAPTVVAPSLRGVGLKGLSPPFAIGGDFGVRTELGVGYGHGGTRASLQAHLLDVVPGGGPILDLTPLEADRLAAFLEALDTGLAPAAATAFVAHAANAAAVQANELAFLLDQAQRGNCDAVFHYGPVDHFGDTAYRSGLYDPASGAFDQASAALPPVTPAQLIQLAQLGTPVLFQGVPLLAGWPAAMDRDNDRLLDLDELAMELDPEKEDVDGDLFPDGYEVLWGMDPRHHDDASPDTVAPQLRGGVRTVYATQHAVKLEFETSEVTRVVVTLQDGQPLLRRPLKSLFDDSFSFVVNELEPGTHYELQLRLTDPANNVTQVTLPVDTQSRRLAAPAHVEELELTIDGAQPQATIRGRVRLATPDGPPPIGYNIVGGFYHVTTRGHVTAIATEAQTWMVLQDGTAHFSLPVPQGIAQGSGSFVFAVQRIDAPPGAPPYVKAEDATALATKVW